MRIIPNKTALVRDVAKKSDGMQTAGGSSDPSATPLSLGSAGHSRSSRLFDEASPAVLTVGFKALQARASEALISLKSISNTPSPRDAGAPPSTTPFSASAGTPSSTDV